MNLFALLFFVLGQPNSTSIDSVSLKEYTELKVDAELRPRFELRNGYRMLRNDTTSAAGFVSARTRLNLQYDHPKYAMVFSIQDIRVWGEDDPRSTTGTIQLFEGYFDLKFKYGLKLRVGRQRLMYDNQRLFAQNDWRQNANAHDGLRLSWKGKQLESELSSFFNQSSEQVFGTAFNTPGFSTYKFLGVHYLKATLSERFTLTTLNAVDGFQDLVDKEHVHFRFTSGGRLEWKKNNWYLTLASYYQYGRTISNQQISAFYAQPEIKWERKEKAFVRLGAELLSGQNVYDTLDKTYRSFVPLYGVAHRFNGYMDQFTSFPNDLNSRGLFNPYLFLSITLNKKLSVRTDVHAFFTMTEVRDTDGAALNALMAIENDWLLNYKMNDATNLEWGVCWLVPERSMVMVKGDGVDGKLNYWTYVMLTFRPTLFTSKKELK
jgi:hypothetical protein